MRLRGTGEKLRRCRYGASALWSFRGDLVGGTARWLEECVALFFRSEAAPLLLDIRDAGLIDSAGAAALDACNGSHAAFRLVGPPASWLDLPVTVRVALRGLRSEPDLETALAASATSTREGAAEQRRHPRIPLQLPVEVFCAGRTAQASLRDISRGGLRLSSLPEGWIGDLRRAGVKTAFDILGIADDPLGRELTAGFGGGAMTAVPVCAQPGGVIGARFPDARPPV